MKVASDVLVVRGDINRKILPDVLKAVEAKKADVLYLVLDTYGGELEVGFRIMNLLNANYKIIYAVVPDKAMSTGTLMSVGCDKIYMYHSSSLGPLDVQIEHPTDGSWISTLDVRDTMNTLISHSEVAAERFFRQIYHKFGLGKAEAAKIASDKAVKLIQPIVDKIDPYHLHKSFRSAEVGSKFGAALLKTRMHKNNHRIADMIGSILANNYEAHSYAITLEEARSNLLLKAEDLATITEWQELKPIYESFSNGVHYEYVAATVTQPAVPNTTNALAVVPHPKKTAKKVTK